MHSGLLALTGHIYIYIYIYVYYNIYIYIYIWTNPAAVGKYSSAPFAEVGILQKWEDQGGSGM